MTNTPKYDIIIMVKEELRQVPLLLNSKQSRTSTIGNLPKIHKKEVVKMLVMIPESFGWALVGAVALVDVIGVIHCVKWFIKIRKENKEEE